ncbi:putative aspartate aminotransferase/Glutamic oxaloacetic transaminase AAT2/GOT1 [Paramyrothecium foliicola]|nr:putative aspartate aminotransferase/Glutamic oxaloacetic transaminase AAT2/GOT1 [Paramyrothecium foliicola]
MGSSGAGTQSFFAAVEKVPADRIFALTAQFVKDESPNKVNLGQGAYRDENGSPWILPSVAEARSQLLHNGLQHEYLPITGHPGFKESTTRVVLGSDLFREKKDQIAICQGLSGTGSLRLAARLIARAWPQVPKILISEPAYLNHHNVFRTAGLECISFKYYDDNSKNVDMASYKQALEAAEAGTVVLLHACAHNPTGCDPSEDEWREIGTIIKSKGLFPLFDAAYLGFNSGSFDVDAFPIRHFIGDLGLEAAVCVSFAKNMGLYGERTGAVLLHTQSQTDAVNCASALEQIQRSEVSNPPAFGAKIAHLIMTNEKLGKQWSEDLITMSGRIKKMRQLLYERLCEQGAPGNWIHIIRQSGMFGFLGLSSAVVTELREKHHIYMADSSRVSIAGLNESNVTYVANAIAECVRAESAGSL